MTTPRIELTDELLARMEEMKNPNPQLTIIPDSGVLAYLAQPFRVFEMNDCDWWMAQSITEARRDYAAHTNAQDGEPEDDARELTDEEMESKVFTDDSDGGFPAEGVNRSFKAELELQVKQDPSSRFFATNQF